MHLAAPPVADTPRTGYPYLDVALDPPGGVIALAHRGGAGHPELNGIENTLAAFEHAAALGYDYLETDVHATRDGVLVAFHDAVLDRLTDGDGAVADLTAAQLDRTRISGDHRVPRMGELLEAIPRARFNIDLKSDAAVRPLVDLLERTAAHDRVCVGSFSSSRLREFRHLTEDRVATSAAPAEVAFVLGAPRAVLRAWAAARYRPAALQVPHRRGRVEVVTQRLVRRAHAAGLHVHVWTIDERDEMTELLDLGVDGLITDRTDVLRDVLTSRGLWRSPE